MSFEDFQNQVNKAKTASEDRRIDLKTATAKSRQYQAQKRPAAARDWPRWREKPRSVWQQTKQCQRRVCPGDYGLARRPMPTH